MLAWVIAGACTDGVTAPPPGAPYLAIVVQVSAPEEVGNRGPYRFRIRELSGTIKFDTVIRATPADTIILSVEPATYVVEIGEVPATCGVRDGVQYLVVPPKTNTTIARFTLVCRNAITISVLSDGQLVDSGYVYTVEGAKGLTRVGPLAPNDTVLLDALPAGQYVVALRLVDDNCIILSDGGVTVPVEIQSRGGATVNFRVTCSEPARRPRITRFRATYGDGGVGMVFSIVDPDRDVERITWDVTDCRRRSVLPGGLRRRDGFAGWPNVTGKDTAIVIGGFDMPLSPEQLVGKCHAVYIGDERGNISEILEVPVVERNAFARPGALRFNAFSVGIQALRIALDVIDPNDDFLGVFVYYNLRDGIVSLPPDGQPDQIGRAHV